MDRLSLIVEVAEKLNWSKAAVENAVLCAFLFGKSGSGVVDLVEALRKAGDNSPEILEILSLLNWYFEQYDLRLKSEPVESWLSKNAKGSISPKLS
jgi:hypothetical protein